MTEQLISFETAKLAKEKGLSVEGRTYYFPKRSIELPTIRHDGLPFDWNKFRDMAGDSDYYSAPTQSLLQKWLREKQGQHILLIPTITDAWTYKTVKITSELDDDFILGLKSVDEIPPYTGVSGEDFRTYEDALEVALFEALKLIS